MDAIEIPVPSLELRFGTHAEALASAETLRFAMQVLVKNADVIVRQPPTVRHAPPPGDEPMRYEVSTRFMALAPLEAKPVLRMIDVGTYKVQRKPADPEPGVCHVMVDLETWGRRPGCAIRSIGARVFGPHGLGEEFYINVSRADQELVGLHIDGETALWWEQQNAEARAALEVNQVPAIHALSKFSAWLCLMGSPSKIRIWGNGAGFDNTILDAVYALTGVVRPWNFWNDRCYRTVKNLYRTEKVGPHQGPAHHAGADAATQAEHLVRILNKHDLWTTV